MQNILPFTEQETYRLNLFSLERELPLVQINPDTWIASFVLLGDVELTNYCAKNMIDRLSQIDYDYLVVPETKAIPLAETICQLLLQKGALRNYIVLRKSVKSYMRDPLTATVNSITTAQQQRIVINGLDAQKIRNKKVALIDDVISTGNSFRAMLHLIGQAEAVPVFAGAILKEGAFDLKDIESGIQGGSLQTFQDLPLFVKR